MEEYIYVSVCVAISFFVFKFVLNKINKEGEKNKDVMKDSIYVCLITFMVIFVYSNYFKKGSGKTPVFTNEPGF
uniref:Uncharacterized protein n=1 Tax=viral metagenome TaxID=1070528 RepID=A0A6C0ETG4_9ZZZZ